MKHNGINKDFIYMNLKSRRFSILFLLDWSLIMIERFLNQIHKKICQLEYDGEGYFLLKSIDESEDRINLTFELPMKDGSEKWKVACLDAKERLIKSNIFSNMEVFEEHILLSQYVQDRCELYFRGNSYESKSSIIGDLYIAHKKIVKGWIPFGEYINEIDGQVNLLEDGFGMIADGPQNIISEYAKVLDKYNLKPTIRNLGRYKFWDGTRWGYSEKKHYVLVCDDSYVIATGYTESYLIGQ